MIAKLLERGPTPAEQREIPIIKDEFLIGRGPDCDLRLGVSAISRHHCLLRLRGEEAMLIDLGSVNGTFLTGHRIRSQALLHSGDEVAVGPFRFVLELGTQDGIGWYTEPGADPGATTFRLKDAKPAPEKERGHPPGEAGGQGDSVR